MIVRICVLTDSSRPTKGFPDPTHYLLTYENYVNVSGFALQKLVEDTPPTEENDGIDQSGISLGADGLELQGKKLQQIHNFIFIYYFFPEIIEFQITQNPHQFR